MVLGDPIKGRISVAYLVIIVIMSPVQRDLIGMNK